MILFTSLLLLLLTGIHCDQVICTSLPVCRYYLLQSTIHYSPFRYQSLGYLSLDGQPQGATSLQNRPLSFAIPMFLNISYGNSGNYFSYLTINSYNPSTQQSVSVKCTYKGTGVSDPFYPEQIQQAQAYQFQSCNDVTQQGQTLTGLPILQPGSFILASAVILQVDNGGNQNDDMTSIQFPLQETPQNPWQDGPYCFQEQPVKVVSAGGNGGNMDYVSSGVFTETTALAGCTTSYTATTTTTTTTTTSTRTTVRTMTTTTAGQLASQSLTVQPVTANPTSVRTRPTSQPMPTSTSQPSEWSSPLGNLTQTIALSVGIFIALLLVVLLFLLLLKKMELIGNRKQFYTANDQEKGWNGKAWIQSQNSLDSQVVNSHETMIPYYDQQDFDLIYGGYQQQQEDGYFADQSLEQPVLEMNHLDQTMINTKEVIALPGFLKIDYHSDVRPFKTMAEGGGGILYEAELLEDRLRQKHRVRKVALKVVKNPGSWSDEEMSENFKHEVSIMWSLNFIDNVVKLIGYTEEPFSIIMKYYERSLYQIIKSQEAQQLLPIEQCLRYAYQMSNAMTEIHSMGIVHRDLKTANLLLDAPVEDLSYWKIIICDFGLAKIIGDIDVKAIKNVDIQGLSIRYAAPEVFKRMYLGMAKSKEALQISRVEPELEMKADIYAFGIILWEMIERKGSWQDLTNEEIEMQVREGQRPLFSNETIEQSKINEKYVLLMESTEQCWHHDPLKRPSFKQVKMELEGVYLELPQPDWSKFEEERRMRTYSSMAASKQNLTQTGRGLQAPRPRQLTTSMVLRNNLDTGERHLRAQSQPPL